MNLELELQTVPKTGRQIRDAVLDDLERRNRKWLAEARRFAERWARQTGTVSINDVRGYCPPPPDVHPNVLGAVFRNKLFQTIGYTQAEHPGAHARIVRVYTIRGSQW